MPTFYISFYFSANSMLRIGSFKYIFFDIFLKKVSLFFKISIFTFYQSVHNWEQFATKQMKRIVNVIVVIKDIPVRRYHVWNPATDTKKVYVKYYLPGKQIREDLDHHRGAAFIYLPVQVASWLAKIFVITEDFDSHLLAAPRSLLSAVSFVNSWYQLAPEI